MEYKSDGDTNGNWCARHSKKGLVQRQEYLEIGRRVETIQMTSLISARILETCGDLLSLRT